MNYTLEEKSQKVETASRRSNETNDCGVCAIAVATGAQYEDVRALMKKHGRKDRGASFYPQMKKTLADLGFEVEEIDGSDARSQFGRTAMTAKHNMPKNEKYILHFSRHVAGWDGEHLVDWAHDRRKRVIGAWKITKSDEEKPKQLSRFNETFVVTDFAKMCEELEEQYSVDPIQLCIFPPRKRRQTIIEKRLRAGCNGKWINAVELTGDAAVLHRKATGLKGKVFTFFGMAED